MPTLPSFISYRPGKKAKAAIKAPFSLLRGDNSTTSSTPSHRQFTPTDVIDINSDRYSLDFDGGKPSRSFEQDIFDDPRSSQTNLTADSSPQVELDIDLSSNGFSDWLEAFSGADAKQEALKRLSRMKTLHVKRDESKEGKDKANRSEDFASFSDDMVASLLGRDAPYLDTLPEHDDASTESSSPNPLTSSPTTLRDGSSVNNSQASRPTDLSIGTSITTRPLSSHSDTAFSALSGTTLARALISNSFILSAERSSRYRSGIGAGLTRSDSTTLPPDSLAMLYNDGFSIGPDAPPIPPNAEFLYEPPRRSRNGEKATEQGSRRQYSTGTLNGKLSSESLSISSNTRPDSAIINAEADFDLQPPLPNTSPRVAPSIPRSPLPQTPSPRQPIDEATSPNQVTTPASFQEVTHHLPLDAQLLSPDFNSSSPVPSSEGHASPKELDGLLNYYSAPDHPEMVFGGIFMPAFSPISEESSSQLSPPLPYRSDKREYRRSQPTGARSPLSGSHRVRGDSMLLPRNDQLAGPRPQLLQPVEQGSQSNIAAGSPTTSDSSFYFPGGDSPEAALNRPQLGKVFDGQTLGGVPNPIRIVRDSRDINAYDITVTSLSGDTTSLEEGITVTQEFPETPDAFSPMFSAGPNRSAFQPGDGHEESSMPTSPKSATILGPSNGHPNLAAQMLLNRASVRYPTQRGLGGIRTTTTTSSVSPSRRIADISESPEVAKPPTPSHTEDNVTPEGTPPLSSIELSASRSNVSPSLGGSRSPSRGPNVGQDASDSSSSIYTSSVDKDSTSKPRMKSLPSIPMNSPVVSLSPDDESPSISILDTSTIPVEIAEAIPDLPDRPPTPSQTLKAPAPRGRLPAALTISKHTSVSGPGGPVAVNGADQSGQASPELEQPQNNLPVTPVLANPFLAQSSLTYQYEAPQGRASDIFRGTSLGSPPPYYSVVSEALMQDNRSPDHNLPGFPPSSPHSQALDNIPGPSGAELTHSGNDNGRQLENSFVNQRARIRPPLPAGPRRPSQQLASSPGPMRERPGSMSSVASSLVFDTRTRPSLRYNNPAPSPTFRAPTPKWKGYTMEVAKWTFTSAQLQAIVSRAIRQSAEASSIRLLRLEVLDNDIPEEIESLTSQRTDIKKKYKALTRKRATILDLLHSSLSALEDGSSTHRLLRQLDELREVTQTLDRLTEEIYSVDQQLSHLESLTHNHTGSALAMALRKLNSSFLKQVAENQVLRSQIQSLEAERDEAWQQAQNVAKEYDQINDNIPSPSKRSSRVSAKRKSSAQISRAGLRTPSQRLSRRSSPGSSAAAIFNSSAVGNKLPPLLRRRPTDILTYSPVRSSAALSTSGVTPTSEARALAQAQDELYAMLGIRNPERPLHRSRSEIGLGSPVTASSDLLSPRSTEGPWIRRSSLPGALSLTEAYNVMAADRNAVLATIDMLSATE